MRYKIPLLECKAFPMVRVVYIAARTNLADQVIRLWDLQYLAVC
jgi:hypothetical protein